MLCWRGLRGSCGSVSARLLLRVVCAHSRPDCAADKPGSSQTSCAREAISCARRPGARPLSACAVSAICLRSSCPMVPLPDCARPALCPVLTQRMWMPVMVR
eukprot:2578783-Rhodomonas_salina.3